MSRRVILILIVIMALVMTSLILVQTNSILKALEIKEEQFNGQVKSALTTVVYQLEMDEASSLVELAKDFSTSRNNGIFPGNIQQSIPGSLSMDRKILSYQHSQQTLGLVHSEEIAIAFGNIEDENIPNERGKPGEYANAFDRIHESDGFAREQLQTQAAILSRLPIKDRIPDFSELKRSIKAELKGQNINLDFRIAIKTFSEGKGQLIYGDKNFTSNEQSDYKILLYPHDDILKANYIYLYFPKQNSYLLKETGFLVIPTFVLTAMLIGIFVFTILIILKQKKLSNIKNDFINNMTHELKTPISTISLASQMLRDNTVTNTPKTIEHITGIIFQESKRLTTQVEKVLQMAVFNEGKLKLKFKDVNINTLINSVVLNFELRVKSKNGELTADLKANPEIIKADEVHLTNVLFNLLDNAVKYSKDEPKINISSEIKDEYLVVSVKDNGIGIQSEHVGQIFERFYRVPTGNVHDVKGFGLGLSYVKIIVDAHKGKIKVDSAPNKGTKFMIYFPINIEEHGKKSKIAIGRG
jgi:two-component system, OmpR family, phosphate regulon sensor histidine kinase PhoR